MYGMKSQSIPSYPTYCNDYQERSAKQNENTHVLGKDLRRKVDGLDRLNVERPTYRTRISTTDSIFQHGEALKTQRNKAKDTANQMKQLRYHFKDISSKIIRSKTSTSARQVANQAKREVLRLKRQKQSGEYDAEEIDAAIAHAKAMERVARKKVRHLEQEEMAKAASSEGAFEKGEDDSRVDTKEEETEQTNEELQQSQEELQQSQEELYEAQETEAPDSIESAMLSDMEEVSAEMMNAMMEELFEDVSEEMMEEMLDDISEEMMAYDRDMDEQELKELKIKHRNKEMKDIVKADAEYLKTIFKHMQDMQKAGIAPQMTQMSSNAMAFNMTPSVELPAGYERPVAIDISL